MGTRYSCHKCGLDLPVINKLQNPCYGCLEAENKRLREALEQIKEYWNGRKRQDRYQKRQN